MEEVQWHKDCCARKTSVAMSSNQPNVEDSDDTLVKISDVIPSEFRSLFKYERLNAMQSILLPQILHSDVNMVVAAPTGSGKTVVHELAIVRLLLTKVAKDIKCVFIAPNKALCQQRCVEWQKKFGRLGISVIEVTGDIDMSRSLQLVAIANIIVTTPEKWDSLTRSWRRHVFLLGAIDLLLLDEVHHLGEDRGPTLETVVVRMRILCAAYIKRLDEEENGKIDDGGSVVRKSKAGFTCMRIIALSATLPNLTDIGDWLNCPRESVHFFDEGFRPVPLTVHALSYGSAKTPFLFEKSLDDKVPEVVRNYSEGKQTLIFCSSKKGSESLAKLLLLKLGSSRRRFTNTNGESSIQDSLLRDLVSKGFGYHHGGLPADDRAAVEELYLSGRIHILCSTSTLAHGVNLPAHLVIIKGTYCWKGGAKGYEKLAKSDVIQMIGRAGRPGYDTNGIAVIMTSSEEKKNYEEVSLGADIVESHLPTILVEAICAEITQTVIQNAQQAIEWLKSTFFYVRVCRNPTQYCFDGAKDSLSLDSMLMAMCTKALSDLSVANIIQYDLLTHAVTALPEAHIMTKHVIKFETMVTLMKLPYNCNMPALFQEISSCCELLKPLRRNEKSLLNSFMKFIRFPLKIKVQDSATKGYVLMQAAVERLPITDFSLRVEQSEIVEVALRILSALQSLCIERSRGNLIETAVLMDRALRIRMWESDYGSVFFQCQGLSEPTRKGLNEKPVRNVNDLENCSASRVQDLLSCSNYEAKQILLFSKMFKKWTLDLYVNYGLIADTAGTGATVDFDKEVMRIDVVRTSVHNSSAVIGQSMANHPYPDNRMIDITPPSFHLICYHAQTSLLLCYRMLAFEKISDSDRDDESILRSYSVPLPTNIFLGDVKCLLLSSIVGLDTVLMPRSVPTIEKNPELSPVVAKTRASIKLQNKRTLAQPASKAENRGEIGGRISIQKNLTGEKHFMTMPDGDMRAWMVRKATGTIHSSIEEPLSMLKEEGHRRDEAEKTRNAVGRVDSNSSYSCHPLERDNIQATSVMTSIGDDQIRGSCNSDANYFGAYDYISSPSTLVQKCNSSAAQQVISTLNSSRLQKHGTTEISKFPQKLFSNDMKQKREKFCIQSSPYKSEPDWSKVIPAQSDTNGQTDKSAFARLFARNSDGGHEDDNMKNKIWVQSARSRTIVDLERSERSGEDNTPSKIDESYLVANDSDNKQWMHQGNSAVSGGCSAELAVLRRKSIELQLDSIPIRRLRTAASPGFKENEYLSYAHYGTDTKNNQHMDVCVDTDYFGGRHIIRKGENFAQQPSGSDRGDRLRSNDTLHPEPQNYINEYDTRDSRPKEMDQMDNRQHLNSYFDDESEKYSSNSCSQKEIRNLRMKLKTSKEITPQMVGKQMVSGINKRSRFTHSCDSNDDGECKAHMLDMDSDYFIQERRVQPVSPLPNKNPIHRIFPRLTHLKKSVNTCVDSALGKEILDCNVRYWSSKESTIDVGEVTVEVTATNAVQGRFIKQQPPNMVTPSGHIQWLLHHKSQPAEQRSTVDTAKSMTLASHSNESENENFEAGFF